MAPLGLSSPLRILRPDDPARIALQTGTERLLSLQCTDEGWEGSWPRYAGSRPGATNIVALAALGLAEAYRTLQEATCLEGARRAALFIVNHLGVGAAAARYHPRLTGTDIVLLHRLHALTGEDSYYTRAAEEWRNLRGYFYFASADELSRFFGKIDRQAGAWDLAFYLEAADLAGDTTWADGAATVLSRTLSSPYAEFTNPYRALNLAAAVRALSGQGYGALHRAALEGLTGALSEAVEADSVGHSVQDTANACLALQYAGASWRPFAARLAEWLVARQEAWGGWMEEGVQYPHVAGEALTALAVHLGRRGSRDRATSGARGRRPSGRGVRRLLVGGHDPVAPFDGI